MKLFADTADLRELKELDEMGLICGITTNPTIASQTGKNLVDVLANIAKEFPEIPVFGQVVAKDTEGMVAEARKIVTAGKNIVVKLPATREAVKAIKILHAEGIKTCATAVLTASQGFLCATAGADYVAPYTGQNDVIGYDGLVTLEQLCDVIHEEACRQRCWPLPSKSLRKSWNTLWPARILSPCLTMCSPTLLTALCL